MSEVRWRKASRSAENGGNCVELARWRKSSRSGQNGGNCVELASWRKASRSGHNGGECVELADLETVVGVRDSKRPEGAVLVFGRSELAAFMNAVKSGQLDL